MSGFLKCRILLARHQHLMPALPSSSPAASTALFLLE